MRVDAEEALTDEPRDPTAQVDRQEVHRVHQDDPHEDRQGERPDQGARVGEDVLHLLVDELDHDLDHVLQPAGPLQLQVPADLPGDQHEDTGERQRHQEGVEEEDGEIGERRGLVRCGVTPDTGVGQVVLDVGDRIEGAVRRCLAHPHFSTRAPALSTPDRAIAPAM